jgi:hypothetical protein
MAIRTNKTQTPSAVSETPAVEETTPTETPAAQEEVKASEPTPEAPKTETKKPAAPPAVKSAAGAVAVHTGDVLTFLQLRNALDPELYGNTFPRIVPASGKIRTDGGIQLGEYLDVQAISTSDRWMYAPVADMKKDPDSTKYCRASYDGKTIPDRDGGPSMTFEEWEEMAADIAVKNNKEPYPEWRLSKYLDVFAIIFNADPKFLVTAQKIGMVQISVSSTATKAFNSFFMQGPLNVNRGLLPIDKQTCMRIAAAPGPIVGKDYTILVPELVPEEILAAYTPVQLF